MPAHDHSSALEPSAAAFTGSSSPPSSRVAGFVALGGLIAGALDILYAWVFWWLRAGVPMQRILQSVAAGLLGPAGATSGGARTAALGLALHFFIATSMSITYYIVARRLPLLVRRPLACGLAYGLLLYGIMQYIVVPLSAAARGGAPNPLWITLSILVHMVFIGLPIALTTRAALRAR